MRTYHIETLDEIFRKSVQEYIDSLAKPVGSLGKLEGVARKIATIQNTLRPELKNPHHLLFIADHGIADEGTSPSPKEITWQQAINITQNGAGINIFTTQHDFKLLIVDAGTDYDFPQDLGIIDRKIRKGTRNFLHEAALTFDEVETALTYGEEIVSLAAQNNCNIVSIGELGIGNTSVASIWMSLLTNIPLEQCVGAGSGSSEGFTLRKYEILQQSVNRYTGPLTPMTIMSEFGGLEMIMAVGAMLRAAELKMTILIDGFLMSNSLLMASHINPEVEQYAIFSHKSEEKGHSLLLEYLGVEPLLHLNFYLGEGTGAVCAYPLIASSVRMMNQMKSFEESRISNIPSL
ncbi:nicotinate-nucleotide--dimethylbenzimidazole phosphoribosyltransferase [Wohlfahrtiimonas larvae]|uniref:Nicotinate-nucleotide--dimethylbenzimidazole phosphoribosyltransferase n=1 Tax=Wohlfahrtiimonas larvae TaxID=1157986 RepID=A0ABP9MV89_9GAMM|nr:nicotinate-nucleotide--dimethylbenzimidazole phosphoribosyltransferase [Wohlfahrtiimonas larvae]